MRILLVEDEDAIADPLSDGLRREGFVVERAATGAQALAAGETDFVLLDLRLPDVDGLDVCRGLRARSDVPIIMVSARGEESDRVVGLELGADDYIVKPFGLRELIARIRAVTRRTEPRAHAPSVLHVAGLAIDERARRVQLDERRARADAEGVRPTRDPGAGRRRSGQPAAAARGGLEHDVVRIDQDDRRPCRLTPTQARRSGLDRDGARRRLPAANVTRRLVAGYLGIALFVLVALEVPLGVQNQRNERHDVEIKVERDATVLSSYAEDAVQTAEPAAARRRRPLRLQLRTSAGTRAS